MNHDQLSTEMHDLTWEHVVYHEITGKGIKGVERFGVHAVRDIMATHMLKTTNNVDLAADSIQDSVRMVLQHYARFLTSDRTKRVQAALKVDLPQGNWGD